MCLVNDNETFRANKHFVSLELAARAQAGLTIRGGEVVEGAGRVRVEAGAWLDLLCHGYEGVPAPSFTWRGPARPSSGSSLLVQQVSLELTRSWHPRPPEVTPPVCRAPRCGATRATPTRAARWRATGRSWATPTRASAAPSRRRPRTGGGWGQQGGGRGD